MPAGEHESFCGAVRESVLPALVIACALEVIVWFGFLGWANPMFARAVHAGSGALQDDIREIRDRIERRHNRPRESTFAPKVVVIDDNLFAGYYGGSSPLERGKVAGQIKDIAKRKPKLIAIDLDISGSPVTRNDVMSEDVFCALRSITRQGQCGSPTAERSRQEAAPCGTQVVLIEPFRTHVSGPADHAAIAANKAACKWVKVVHKELGSCVRFARSDIDQTGSRAVFFNPKAPTLGVIAEGLVRSNGKSNPASAALEPRETEVCAPIGTALIPRDVETNEAKKLINTALIFAVNEEKTLRQQSGKDDSNRYVSVKANAVRSFEALQEGDVVFFGGTWGDTDKHQTAAIENVDGVVVHAAIFDSLRVPKRTHSVLVFLADFAIGTLTGAAFVLLWGKYNTMLMKFSVAGGHERIARHLKHEPIAEEAIRSYAIVLRNFLLAWGVMIAIVWLLLKASAAILAWGTWVNPAAMVLGMFVHSFLSSRAKLARIKEDERDIPTIIREGWDLATVGIWRAVSGIYRRRGWTFVQLVFVGGRWLILFVIVGGGIFVVGLHAFEEWFGGH